MIISGYKIKGSRFVGIYQSYFQKWLGRKTSSPMMLVYTMIVFFPKRWKYDCSEVVS